MGWLLKNDFAVLLNVRERIMLKVCYEEGELIVKLTLSFYDPDSQHISWPSKEILLE